MKNIIKGFIIGVGKIIPGVSGSMLAILMNVYERALSIISDLKNMRWNDFTFIISLAAGVFIGISFLSGFINLLLKKHYLSTMLLFIGLISSGIPDVIKFTFNEKTKKNVNIKYILIIIIAFLLAFTLTMLGEVTFTGAKTIDYTYNYILMFYIIGFLEAFSSIIPGISGTAIFMSIGCYETLLNIYKNILNPIYFMYTGTYFLGVITGILILSKLITFLLQNYKELTYAIILGFLLESIFGMFLLILKENNYFNIFSLVLLPLGYIIGNKINVLLSKE